MNASLSRLRRPGWRPCGPSHFEGGGTPSPLDSSPSPTARTSWERSRMDPPGKRRTARAEGTLLPYEKRETANGRMTGWEPVLPRTATARAGGKLLPNGGRGSVSPPYRTANGRREGDGQGVTRRRVDRWRAGRSWPAFQPSGGAPVGRRRLRGCRPPLSARSDDAARPLPPLA